MAVPKPKSYFFFGKIWKPTGLQHTIIVHPGESIQEALDKLVPGGTVFLKSGTYVGEVFKIEKGKHLGVHGQKLTMKDCVIQGDGHLDMGDRALFKGNDVSMAEGVRFGHKSRIIGNVFRGPIVEKTSDLKGTYFSSL